MIRHQPEAPAFRVAVIRASDSVQVGTMPAAPGMRLSYGWLVVRVAGKSMTIKRAEGVSEERHTGLCSVTVAEARRFGFPRA